MRDIRHYDVFKLADALVLRVYELAASFPKYESYGLTSQMRRSAYSIPMNLVEGAARTGSREFAQFVNVTIGSCEEVRYQLHLAQALRYLTPAQQQDLDSEYEKVKQMLSKLLGTLGSDAPRHHRSS